MPFANLHIPSLGLTQLASAVRNRFAERVSVQAHYLNHDFAHFFGLQTYREIITLREHQNSGIGDWLFRQVAFPAAPDNIDEFLTRFYPLASPRWRHFKSFVADVRERLPAFLDQLIETHGLAEADLVGLTSMFAQNVPSFALAHRIREQNPNTVIVMGGANCEAPMGQEIVRGVSQVDFVFSGPALRSFPDLIGCLMEGDQAQSHRIHGVFSKQNVDRVLGGKSGADGARSGVTLLPSPGAIMPLGQDNDIDVEIDLDFHAFLDDLERNFAGEVVPALTFETSRGCWWGERSHCTFCGLNSLTMNYRSMAAEHAQRLMRSLFERYSERCQQYICVDNIMPREYIKDVFAHLEPPPDTTIFYEVKADLDEDDLGVLARAGVTILQPGIESFATSTLKLMKKGVSAFRNIRFLQGCLRYNIYPTWNLLVGFPGEREEVYEKYVTDLPRLVHLPPPSGVYPVRFDRYSPYFNKADEYGLDLEPVEFYRLIYPFDEDVLRNIAYYFVDQNYDALYFQEMAGWLSKLQRLVLHWQRMWHGHHHSARPQMHLTTDGGAPAVFDSRSGREVTTRVTDADRALLIDLIEAKQLDRVLAGGDEVVERIDRFRRQGWLFEDRGRVMSVVLPAPAAPSRHHTSPIADFNLDVDISDVPPIVEPVAGEGAVDETGRPALVPVARDQRRVSRSKLVSRTSEGAYGQAE